MDIKETWFVLSAEGYTHHRPMSGMTEDKPESAFLRKVSVGYVKVASINDSTKEHLNG